MDDPKQSVSSRLSTSTMSLFGKFARAPPRPPPKDNWYIQNQLASKSSVSLAPSAATSVSYNTLQPSPYGRSFAQDREFANDSHETLQVPHAPPLAIRSHSDLSTLSIPRTMSPVSTRTTNATLSAADAQQGGGFRRGFVSKLSNSLGRRTTIKAGQTPTRRQGPMSFFTRSNSSQATFSSTMDGRDSDDVGIYESPVGDEGVSKPWNVKHDLHVDEDLGNLPPEWMDRLRQSGLRDDDIISVTSRRAHRKTYLKNHPDVSPDSVHPRAGSPFSPATTLSYSQSTSSTSSSASPVDERVASPVSSQNHNHSIANGVLASGTSASATGRHVNGTLPASSLPARSTSLRRPMVSMTGPRMASIRKASTPASSRSSHSHSDSAGRTSLSNSSSNHSGGAAAAADDLSLAEDSETIDAELYDDPNTATAAQFTIPEASASVATPLRNRGDGDGELGAGDARGRDLREVLPRTDEEPEDLSNASTTPNLRSQSPSVPSYTAVHSAPKRNPNGLPVVPPLRMNTPSMVGTFRVMNASPPSPPPAYDLPSAGSPLERFAQGRSDDKAGSSNASSARTETRRSEETLTPEVLMRGASEGITQAVEVTRDEDGETEDTAGVEDDELPPRSSALPPRLSFHGDDLGLGDWSQSLFSSLGTPDLGIDLSSFSASTPSPPVARCSPPSAPAPPLQREGKLSSDTPSSPPKKQVTVPPLVLSNKGFTVPNVVIDTDDDEGLQEHATEQNEGSGKGSGSSSFRLSTTPLFNEVLSLVKTTPTSEGSTASYTNSLPSSSRANGRDRAIESPPFTSTYPYLPDPPSRPTPPTSASLRSPAISSGQSHSPKLSPSASPLPSPAPSSSSSQHSGGSSSAHTHNYEFLNTSYGSQRGSTLGQDADGLLSAREDRWSHSTTMTIATVRDVKEATIVHGQKASVGVANAFTVPAPSRQNSKPQLQTSATAGRDLSPARAHEICAERQDGSRSRRTSVASTDSAHSREPSADDFPLPPPSPQSPVAKHSQNQATNPSPVSPTFSVHSPTSLAYMQRSPGLSANFPVSATVTAYTNSPMSATRIAREKPLPSSPVRSLSHSSSGSNNSSSSSSSLMRRDAPTTGSATSCEDETPEPGLPAIPPLPSMAHAETKKDAKALQFSNIRVLSPTGTFTSGVSSEDWLEGEGADTVLDLEPIGLVVTPSQFRQAPLDAGVKGAARLSRGSDGASAVIDWFVDSPSPRQMRSPALRESTMMLCSSPKSQAVKANGSQGSKESPTSPRRPAIQTEGIKSPSLGVASALLQQQQNFLSPASADTARSGNSSNSNSSSSPSSAASSPLARYRGWVSEVVAPLEEFIDHDVEPRTIFANLTEIAEGESGSVFSATLVTLPSSRTSSRSRAPLPPSYALSFSSRRSSRKVGSTVAIKNVPLLPGGSPKLEDLRKELMLMGRVRHENILSMDALYVDLVEDSLWIEMELMERSLADVLALNEVGLKLDESTIARFSSDVLDALAYLDDQGIVHRDLRSDNLLVNGAGILKIADFSHALLVDSAYPTYTDAAGVIYWQAPEMRVGSYNALKVDVWSLGATAWEMAEGIPPFMDLDVSNPRDLPKRWPPLKETDAWSGAFLQFLELCSEPEKQRPAPVELSKTAFISSACQRAHIIDVLSQCRTLEERIHHSSASSEDSDGTVS